MERKILKTYLPSDLTTNRIQMNIPKFNRVQASGLVVLRILIGWHFLYEGVIKAYNPSWTSRSYLLSASILKPFFAWLASDSLITVIDYLNRVDERDHAVDATGQPMIRLERSASGTRTGPSPCTSSASTSRAARCACSSGRRAAARPRRCG